jgi:hypothetical protein
MVPLVVQAQDRSGLRVDWFSPRPSSGGLSRVYIRKQKRGAGSDEHAAFGVGRGGSFRNLWNPVAQVKNDMDGCLNAIEAILSY